MDFKDEIKLLGERVHKLKDSINTEEATKNALIMPFIRTLGYDVFNPFEVVPEFISDIGLKKGEKIDYAIMRDGVPIMLMECKHWKENLNVHDGQLLRYFHVSKAKFGILSNGICYRFYTDLLEPNKMDEKPFMEFEIDTIKDNQIEELKKFHKSYFDLDNIISTASDLKYTAELRQLLHDEFANPTPDFVRHFAKKAYSGVVNNKVLDLFTNLLRKSIANHISDLITDRLTTALKGEDVVVVAEPEPIKEESKIVTTETEKEAFMIVRSILRPIVEVKRIFHRDAQSYFSIILDDKNTKPICRLYLDKAKKYIEYFDENKKGVKEEIVSLDDIYQYQEKLSLTVKSYL